MGKDSHSKSHSSKSAKGHSSRHKSSSGRHRSSGAASSSASGHSLTFLFAISEVHIEQYEIDTWGNARPPTSPQAYDRRDNLMTPVFMYTDGEIVDVSDMYCLFRDQESEIGAIWSNPDHKGHAFPTITYSQATICSCHPLLPYAVVATDATVNETQVLPDGEGINDLTWEPLRFFFPRDPATNVNTGVSQAVFSCTLGSNFEGGHPSTCVAGRNPSWLHTLVPSCYENFSSSAPPSRGLGGDLSILLGLMAFSAPRGNRTPRAYTVFAEGQRWRHRRWHYNRALSSYLRSAADIPEGLIVTVALDPRNPSGSTEDTLSWFEFTDIPVRE